METKQTIEGPTESLNLSDEQQKRITDHELGATGEVFDAITEIWDRHDDSEELLEILEAGIDVVSCIAGGFLGADEAAPVLRSYLERAIDRLPEQEAEREREAKASHE
jgi:hypothetical protein